MSYASMPSFSFILLTVFEKKNFEYFFQIFTLYVAPSTNQTRIDVYETLCPQQMLVHKGGKIKNWGGEFRDVTPTKLQSQNIFKESTGGEGVGLGGGVRMVVNEELN